jgi:predicted transcriptional regulator
MVSISHEDRSILETGIQLFYAKFQILLTFLSDIRDIILRFLEKNPHSSSRDISKALFTPKTTILRLLTDLGLKFHQARCIPYRLSEQQKADRMALSQEML